MLREVAFHTGMMGLIAAFVSAFLSAIIVMRDEKIATVGTPTVLIILGVGLFFGCLPLAFVALIFFVTQK